MSTLTCWTWWRFNVTGRDGQPAQNANLRILRRYVYSGCGEEPENGQEGEKYAYWSRVYSASSDASGIVRVPRNLSLDSAGYNLAVVEQSVYNYIYGNNNYYTALASLPFTSLQDLAESGLSLEDTVPVDMAVYDRQGNVPNWYDRGVVMLTNAGGKLAQPEAVTQFYVYEEDRALYLQPGTYHLAAWFWGQNQESYYLNQKQVSVGSSPVQVTLDGRETAKVQFNLSGKYDEMSAGLVSEEIPFYRSTNAEVQYVTPGRYQVYAYLTRRDPENSSHRWHYDLEDDRGEIEISTAQEQQLSFGGNLTPDLELDKNTLIRGERLTGTSGIKDSFGNRLTYLWISTPYWYDYLRQASRPGEGVRCIHDGPVLWRTADGRLHLLGGDKYTAQSENVTPFLRIYRMQGQSEERVFNKQNWQYFWDFSEDPAQWNSLPGHYRAELAMGVGPEGPIMTGHEEKYCFTIAGELAQPVLDSPRSGVYLNSRTFTVSGLADSYATVHIYVYNGAQAGTMPQATVQADKDGKFTQSITVDADGAWKIFARQQGKDTPSDTVTVYVDTTPPAQPKLQAGLINNNRAVKLAWDSQQSGEAAGVTTIIERDGSKLAELAPGNDFYVDGGIQAQETYTYRIAWVDKAGNRSDYSEAVTITVPLQVVLQEATARAGLSQWGYAALDSSLAISARGTPGQKAQAVLTLQKQAGEEQQTLTLAEQGSGIYNGSFTLAAGTLRVNSVKVQMVKDGQVQAEKDALSAPLYVGGSVPGTIKRGDKPAAGLTVTITGQGTAAGSAGSIYVYQSTTSKADGTFRFTGMPPGTYTVSVYDSAGNATVEQKVTVLAGAVASEVALSLQPVRTLTITVQDQDDANKKLPGIWVMLSSQTTSLWRLTDSSGKAIFTGLATGQYTWSTYGARWQSEAYEDASGTLTIDQDEMAYTISLVSLRSKTGTLQGTVTSGDQPVKDATVSAWSGSAPGWGSATTNDQGKYEIKYLPPADDYQVTFAHPNYKQDTVTGKSIATGQTTTLDQQLSAGATVSGYVYGNGSPLTNVTVQAYSDNQYAYARTDGSGRYQLRGLGAGTWTITAYGRSMGYVNANAVVNIEQSGTGLTRDFTLPELGSIEGTVLDAAGQPLKYIYLMAYQQTDGGYIYSGGTRTDENGYYVIRGLEDGTYKVTTSNWYGYRDETRDQVIVSAGVRATANFTLYTQSDLAQAFGGAGNSFAASAEQVAPGERLTYKATYKNGLQSAVENVQVQLDVPQNTSLVSGSIVVNGTAVSDTVYSDGRITIELGSVAAGAGGTITYQVQVAGDLNQETNLLAKASIKWTTSGQQQEKPLGIASTSVVFTTISAPGQTADGKIKVYGKSLPGALISVYDGSRLLGTTSVTGRWWSLSVELPAPGEGEEETHTLYAQATLNGRASNLSDPATVVYRAGIPVIEDAVITAGWNGDVRANPYTGVITLGLTEKQSIDVRVKFKEGSVAQSVYFTWLDDTYSMNQNDGYFRGSVPYGWTTYGEQLLGLSFQDSAGRWYQFPLALITVLIDPSGYVYEGVPSNRLPGVTAIVQQKLNGQWVNWNAAAYGQVNPQLTDEQGRYGWDVPAGTWRVVFSKDGYETYYSDSDWDGQVPPPKTDLNVNMKSTATPVVTALSPAENANAVPVNSTVSITFSKYMQLSTFNNDTFTVQRRDTGEKVSGSISGVSAEDGLAKTIVFTPATALAPGTTYLITVSKAVQDYTGRSPTADTSWSFTTAQAPDTDPPRVVSTSPVNGASGVSTTTAVTVTFSEPVQGVSESTFTLKYTADGSPVAASVSYDAATRTATLRPGAALAAGTGYTAYLSAAITDAAGNPLTVYSWSFTTATSSGGGSSGGGGGGSSGGSSTTTTTTTPAAPVTQTVSAASGGTVATADQAASITLPAGALSADGQVKLVPVAAESAPATGSLQAGSPVFDITLQGAKLAKPVSLTLKYDRAKLGSVSAEKIGLYYWHETRGKWIYLGGSVDPVAGTVTAQVEHFTKFAVLANPALPVLKDIRNHWAYQDIKRLVGMEVAGGYPDGTYRPENRVTRAEFAKLVVQAMGWAPGSEPLSFADNANIPAWAGGYVATAVQKGLIKGYADNTFRADQAISRAEIATMVMRALGQSKQSELNFSDAASIPAWARGYVAAAVELGIIKGQPGNTFAPAASATRAETATMLARLLKAMGI